MHRLKTEEHVYLTDHVLRSLAQNRIITILDFLREDAIKLSTLTRLSLPEILQVRKDILNKYAAPVLTINSLNIESLEKNNCLSTGIPSVDSALRGGLPVGYITEVCGLADSGKSQFCMQLAMNCVKNTDYRVLYIDTKGDFSAVRIQKILDACGYTHKEMALIMFKIRIIHLWTMDELVGFFKRLKFNEIVLENLSLIIIDSLPCLMFQHLGDDNKIGLTLLNTFVNYARFISKQRDICVVCVNIQTRWVDKEVSDEDDEQSTSYLKEPLYNEKKNRCLGKYWQHIPMIVMYFDKKQDRSSNEEELIRDTNVNVTVINNSQGQSTNTCVIKLNNLGVT